MSKQVSMAAVALHSLPDPENQSFKLAHSFIHQDHSSPPELSKGSGSYFDTCFADTLTKEIVHSLVERGGGIGERSSTEEECASAPHISFETHNAPVLRPGILPSSEAHKHVRSFLQDRRQRRWPRGLSRAPRASGRYLKLDRFITGNRSLDQFSSPIRYNKFPDQLSPTEKIFRRRDRNANPFSPHKTRDVNRQAGGNNIYRRVQSPHFSPHSVDQALFRPTIFNQTPAGLGQSSARGALNAVRASALVAPSHVAKFLEDAMSVEDDRGIYEARIALALDVDLAARVLSCQDLQKEPDWTWSTSRSDQHLRVTWEDNAWKQPGSIEHLKTRPQPRGRDVPSMPFRILDAPLLRDDYYSQPLSFCYTTGLLAVGLGEDVYLWSETKSIEFCPFPMQPVTSVVTSLSFSSPEGQQSILAVGRYTGQVQLWSIFEPEMRFSVCHPAPVCCVSFRPTLSRRESLRFRGTEANGEDLVVGDANGDLWYYSVEWPSEADLISEAWEGAMILLAKVAAHTQQICGLTWSPDELFLATGADDNSCLLFNLRELTATGRQKDSFGERGRFHHPRTRRQPTAFLASRTRSRRQRILASNEPSNMNQDINLINSELGLVLSGGQYTVVIPHNRQKFRLHHLAAVKAMAFAPWQHSLLATGGGIKDGRIHFYHAPTGTLLATINVGAQVTSLIWSKTKREIAATFGYAQPDHAVRIAVFAWPSCQQVLAMPWTYHINTAINPGEDDQRPDPGRAIWAVAYPAGPNTFPHIRKPGNMPEDLRLSFRAGDTSGSSERNSREVVDGSHTTYDISEVGYQSMLPKQEKEGKVWNPRTADEGSIIVAASDETIRFYEIWSGSTKRVLKSSGLLGGSEILEELEGLERPGKEIIR